MRLKYKEKEGMNKVRKAIKIALKENKKAYKLFKERDVETNDEYIYQGWVEALEWVSLVLKTNNEEKP